MKAHTSRPPAGGVRSAAGRGPGRSRIVPQTIGFIGGGNMATALVRGLLASGTARRSAVWVGERSAAQRRRLARSLRVRATDDNRSVVARSETLILAVKPQVIDEVLAELGPALGSGTLVVSIAAGVRLARLQRGLGRQARIVRVMPNTPALVGRGAAVVVGGRHATSRDVKRTLAIFGSVGSAVPVTRERLLDAVTGLSGSGPAFVYLFAEALMEGGRRAGLPRSLAERLVLQTIAGAVAMLNETGKSPRALMADVSSPGGTTLAGLAHLEAHGFLPAVRGAVVSAARRSRELASI